MGKRSEHYFGHIRNGKLPCVHFYSNNTGIASQFTNISLFTLVRKLNLFSNKSFQVLGVLKIPPMKPGFLLPRTGNACLTAVTGEGVAHGLGNGQMEYKVRV